MRHHVVSPNDTARLVKEMVIDLSGKQYLPKEAVTILDMLHTNNWKRPMYYAITVDESQYVRLDKYFEKVGLAYRITPITQKGADAQRSIDAEVMYENLMNKFKWGGVDQTGVYLDETVMKMCKSYRSALFGSLATALLDEGKKEKAIAVLDKAMQVLPVENIPLDMSAWEIANSYIKAGETAKGEQLLNGIADFYMRSLRWIDRLDPQLKLSIREEIERNMYYMQLVFQLGMQQNPDFGSSYREEFNRYMMTFGRPANQ
jgi:hypothetical protein